VRPSLEARAVEQRSGTDGDARVDHDFLVIGAGVCGLYQLYRLRELGADARVLERNPDVGGTWWHNRYPGCRFDSESYTYGYSFSKELLQDWSWSEHFAAQPETLRYLQHVADRFALREHIELGCSVVAATLDDASSTWTLQLADGRTKRCRFLVTALGVLSTPTLPHYPGMASFRGPSFHTSDWPHEGLDLRGKRVAVIGTGATGVQVIGAIAGEVGELVVYQRRPNWCAPLHNRAISQAEMDEIKARYDRIFARCHETPGGFLHGPAPRSFFETPPEERRAFYEKLYASPGFEKWVGNFREVLMNEDANAEFSAFVAEKIRQRVKDPAVAEKLIPKDHGFGVQRVPMETHYYEAYNRDNVRLVDLAEDPILEVTPSGIRSASGERAFDVIVYATGFDAITGAFDRLEIRGRGGRTLREAWSGDPDTYLGLFVHGFPNLVMLAGPQGASNSTNFPRAIESAVDWATRLFAHALAHGVKRIEATAAAQTEWAEQVRQLYQGLLLRNARSWFTGYNENVAGRDRKRNMIYNGGAPRYRKTLARVESSGYAGLTLS
jgi:cation diffusion facilitator CzcD-associated flavoprotein CzcO